MAIGIQRLVRAHRTLLRLPQNLRLLINPDNDFSTLYVRFCHLVDLRMVSSDEPRVVAARSIVQSMGYAINKVALSLAFEPELDASIRLADRFASFITFDSDTAPVEPRLSPGRGDPPEGEGDQGGQEGQVNGHHQNGEDQELPS